MTRLALHWQILIAMVIGGIGGLMMNFSMGDRELTSPVEFPSGEFQPYGYSAPVRISQGTFWSHDRPERILIQVTHSENGKQTVRRIFVGALDKADLKKPAGERLSQIVDWPGEDLTPEQTIEVIRPSLGELKKSDPTAYALFLRYGRSKARVYGDRLKLAGDLFLRMLKMVSVPLIIFSLSTGVLGLGGAERLGKMFSRTLAYYVSTSLLAIITGLLLVNIIQPGVDRDPSAVAAASEVTAPEQGKKLPTVLFEQLENMIPPNPAKAVTEGQFLGIIAFTLAFAICAVLVGGKAADTVRVVAEAGFEVMMKMTMAVIKLAPWVCCA